MAHELTLRRNGRAEMAFTGETPWHGLGQHVTKGASVDVWAVEAGMDWSAEEGTPNVFVAAADSPTGDAELLEFEDYKALYRSDTREPLSIVGSGYQVVQPRDVLEFFRDLTELGGWHIHTAGTLRGGRKLWAMASNSEGAKVGGSDEVMQNLLLATSLDGSLATVVRPTAVRVVCANTLSMALRDERGTAIRINHRSVFDAAEVKEALGLAPSAFDAFMHSARLMADTPIKLDEARHILDRVFGVSAATQAPTAWLNGPSAVEAGNTTAVATRATQRVLSLFSGAGMGANMSTAKGTRWGLLNAVTQYVDHEAGRTADVRLDSAWFGRGQAHKEYAHRLLTPA